MKNRIMWIITFIPLIITAIVMPFLEDKIPMHYDVEGNIDRWGSKTESFLFPVMIIAASLFWQLFILYFRNKQKKSSYDKVIKEAESNANVLCYVAIGMAAMFGVMQCFILYSAYKESKNNYTEAYIDIGSVSCLCIGLLLIVIGNIMPKAKKNSIVGIRTVWSMDNDDTWSLSNRYGGIVAVAAGLIIVVASCFLHQMALITATIAIVIGMAIVSVVLSYLAYKKYS